VRLGQPIRTLRTRQRSKASKSRVVDAGQRESAVWLRRRNGKGAVAVVTRYGCGRGDFFEGCRSAAGIPAVQRVRAPLPSGGGLPSGSARVRWMRR
jgi:hypothetical protein